MTAERERGSIWERSDGRWGWQIQIEGRRKGGTRRTQALAEASLKAARDASEGRRTDDPKLKDWSEEWLRDVVQPPRYSAKTHYAYSFSMKSHVLPILGEKRLSKITRGDTLRLYNEIERKTLANGERIAPKTVALAGSAIRACLECALDYEMIPRNVCAKVGKRGRSSFEGTPLSAEQFRRFADAARGERWEAAFLLTATLGLRKSELLGIKATDFDAPSLRLRVRGTKSEDSDRIAYVPAALGPKLAALEPAKDGRLFPVSDRTLDRDFKRILASAGLPAIRLHDLRHTAATLMLLAGESPQVVSEILGHSSPAITLKVYAHVMDDQKRKASAAMNALLTEEGDCKK